MVWHKLAKPDGFDCYTGKTLNYREAIGQNVTCRDFKPHNGCGNGIHISENPNDGFIGAKIPCSVYVVEPTDGLTEIDETKSKARQIRVLEEVKDLDALFGFDYTGLLSFIEGLKDVPWFNPNCNPDPAWKFFTGKTPNATEDAALNAVCDAARDAARDAAWNASWDAVEDAARNAARGIAWNAARDAARDAARNAVRGIAWNAAWDAVEDAARNAARGIAPNAAWDAAWDAALYAGIAFVCRGLPLTQEHRDHTTARWNAWQKGYGVACDVDGELYVYTTQ